MESETNTDPSLPENDLPETLDRPEKRAQRDRWFRILAIVLLLAIIGGGIFVVQRLTAPQTPNNGSFTAQQKHGGVCVVNGAGLNISNGNPALNAIAAVSTNDIWAVGSLGGQTLAEHWNGTNWQGVPGPNNGTNSSKLNSIAAIASNDIWAVGAISVSASPSTTFGSPNHTLIEHWNGSQWSIVPSPDAVVVTVTGTPPTAQGLNQLNSIAAVSANDIWAVGAADGHPQDHYLANPSPLIEHWNGSQWSLATLPSLPSGALLEGVTAISANDVWAVGNSITPGTNFPEPLFAHWDGQKWSFMSGPGVGVYGGALTAISATGSDNIWAVGAKTQTSKAVPPLVEHWDGTRWNLVNFPQTTQIASLLDVLALSANNVWIVGGSTSVIVEHWDGTHWQAVTQQHTESGGLSGLASTGGKLWMVGTSVTGLQAVPNTLIESTC